MGFFGFFPNCFTTSVFSGEFEKSLIAFHQGYRLRKDMECFRIGVQKSQDAIKRAIGSKFNLLFVPTNRGINLIS